MTAAAPFAINGIASWGDMDANGHMANVAYLTKCVDARMGFFGEHGFPPAEFARRRIGPVVRRDTVEYFREIALMERISVTLACAGMAVDGSRFRLLNEVLRADGQVAARIVSEGGWLDLAARRLCAPPPELLAAMRDMPRSASFEEMPSSLRKAT